MKTMTYQQWSETAVSKYTTNFGYLRRSTRDIYEMQGFDVFEETHFPHNVFKHITTWVKAVDFNIKADSSIMKQAEKHGGIWEEGYYAEEGYGWPMFDDMEKCFNFITEYKASNTNRS